MDESEVLFRIGQRIKFLREQRGFSQLEFSTLCEIEKTNLSRIESGRNNLTVKSLFKIAKALDVSLSGLVAISEFDLKFI